MIRYPEDEGLVDRNEQAPLDDPFIDSYAEDANTARAKKKKEEEAAAAKKKKDEEAAAKKKKEEEDRKKKEAEAAKKKKEEEDKKKKAPEPPAKKEDAKKPMPTVPDKRGSSRREAADKRRKAGKKAKASHAYDDYDSVLHGVDDIDAIMESSEADLFAALEKYEKAKSANDLQQLASTLMELAALPCTPDADAKGYWKQALESSARAVSLESSNSNIVTQAAHLLLRHGLYLSIKGDAEGSEEAFANAVEKYMMVLEQAPVRQVLRFLVLALTGARSLNLYHFLGTSNNGYSAAYIRNQEEKTFSETLQMHMDKMAQFPGSPHGHPLFRAHGFSAIRAVVLGLAIAVHDDLPDDQASLLLQAWDVMTRMEKSDEAVLLGLYLLKLNEEAADIAGLVEAVPNIRDYIVRVNMQKLSETTEDAGEDELADMANAEMEEMLAGMEYDPSQVMGSLKDMQTELTKIEFKTSESSAALSVKDVDVEDLQQIAIESYDVCQFLAARTMSRLCSTAQGASHVANNPGLLKCLALLCVSDKQDVAVAASKAVATLCSNVKSFESFHGIGLVEAAVYLLSHSSSHAALNGAKSLKALAGDETCRVALQSFRQNLGPALLDHLFTSSPELLMLVIWLMHKVFDVSDEESATAFATEAVADIAQEDLDELLDIFLTELPNALDELDKEDVKKPEESKKLPDPAPKKAAAPAETAAKQAKPAEKTLTMVPVTNAKKSPDVSKKNPETPAAKAPPEKSVAQKSAPEPKSSAPVKKAAVAEKEVKRGRGYTQQIEAKVAKSDIGHTLMMTPSDESEIHLDPEAEEELARELAGLEDIDDNLISEQSQIEAGALEEQGEDARAVALLKMGAMLEEQVNTLLDEGDVDGAEVKVDQAIAKYQALLLLNPSMHIGLKRMADALLRKAEFREGQEADELYAKAIEVCNTDIEAHDLEESHCQKVSAMIDRAKNKAAEEEAKGIFNQTRKFLQDAKQAAQYVKDKDEYINAINEVFTYCRLQADSKKGPAVSAVASSGAAGSRASGAAPAKTPAAAAAAATPAAAPAPQKQQAAAAPNASKAPAKAAKASNPDAILRKGSMSVQQKKNTAQKSAAPAVSEKERLQAALDQKKAKSRLGKLWKEGGGNSMFGRKTWKERLFELSESALEYYEKSNQTEKPKGAISLFEVTTVRSVTIPNRPHCFEVVTESRKFPIQAQNDQDREEWIKDIMWNVDRIKLQKKLRVLK